MKQWADDGKNVSDLARTAIEGFVRMEARERRMLALEWTLAECGVCPATLEPLTPLEASNMAGNPVTAVYSRHRCELCEEGLNLWPHFAAMGGGSSPAPSTPATRKEGRRRQDVIGPLMQIWREGEDAILLAQREGEI